MADRALLYFDDLHVGQQFVTGTLSVSREDVLQFARQFDPQPFHLDEAAAQQTLFGGLSGSGWHTAAITMRLIVDSGPPLAGGILGVGGEISWTSPMRPGDTLRVHCEVMELKASRSRADRGTVTIKNETRNQRDEVVQTFVARVVVPRRRPEALVPSST